MFAPVFSLPVAKLPLFLLQNCPHFAHYRGSFAIKQGQSCNWKTKNRGKHAKLKNQGQTCSWTSKQGQLCNFSFFFLGWQLVHVSFRAARTFLPVHSLGGKQGNFLIHCRALRTDLEPFGVLKLFLVKLGSVLKQWWCGTNKSRRTMSREMVSIFLYSFA